MIKPIEIDKTGHSYRFRGEYNLMIGRNTGLVVIYSPIREVICGENVQGLSLDGEDTKRLFLVWNRGSLVERICLGEVDPGIDHDILSLVSEINEVYGRRNAD